MGYAVLHLDKSPGNESAMTEHIERVKIHPNVDPNRIHLNKELIEFPEGVKDRTEAIQHRLNTAGLERKIGKNQVPVIRFMLSGSPEDMARIESEEKLDDWCKDSIDWLKKTYGAKNVVAATLHMDETTPHIHASVVPIVQGERRQKATKQKAEQAEEKSIPKRKYKKKDTNRPRLCADDVMAKIKLIEYQDSYGDAMKKYGLKRGEKGSDARHITLTEFYRNQMIESKNLQTNIELLLTVEDAKRLSIEELKRQEEEAKLKSQQAEEQKKQKESELSQTEVELKEVKSQLKTEKFKGAASEAGSAIMDGISSALGTSKVKRQQQEIENLNAENQSQQQEIVKLNQTINRERAENTKSTTELKAKIDRIYDWFSDTPQLIRMGEYCKSVGFPDEMIKDLVNMKPVYFSGKLYSNEFSQRFETTNSEARLERDPKRPGLFNLLIDKINIIQWFRQKYKEFQQTIGINIKPIQSKGIKM